MRKERCTSGGYTLLELLVVMVLLGLIMAVSVPRFRSTFSSDRLNYSARRLAGAIKGARLQAVRGYGDYLLHFDLEDGRVWTSRVVTTGDSESQDDAGNGAVFRLPAGIRFLDLWTEDGGRKKGGEAVVRFSRKGYAEQAVVRLATVEGRVQTIVVSPFLDRIQMTGGYTDAGGGR